MLKTCDTRQGTVVLKICVIITGAVHCIQVSKYRCSHHISIKVEWTWISNKALLNTTVLLTMAGNLDDELPFDAAYKKCRH